LARRSPSRSPTPTTNSILWAIIHGILGWLYVIYVALFWVIQPVGRISEA